MKHSIRTWLPFTLVFASVAMPAFASDHHVDAVHGNDANGGTSTLDAWRTITHALAVIGSLPLDARTIRVAPGTYDAALGESFPLLPPPRTRIVGTQGSAVTVLAGPAPTLLAYGTVLGNMDAESGADGLTLRTASTGIGVGAGSGSVAPSFHDIRVESMSGPGVHVSAFSFAAFTSGSASATFDRLETVDCSTGVLVESQAGSLSHASAGITLTSSTIRASTNDGLRFTASGEASTNVTLDRCRVLDNGGHGISSNVGGDIVTATLMAKASLVAGNQGSGLSGSAFMSAFGQFGLEDCTLAGNAQAGVHIDNSQKAAMRNCIVAGNGDDFEGFLGSVQAIYTDCANGDFTSFANCIAADPLFVAPAARDYRLRFGSPCVDVGDPASAGLADLDGRVRPLDGDLDTIAVPDMGAMEFAPLAVASFDPESTRLLLELTGPNYGRSILYLSDAPLLLTPESTPFGSFFLVRSTTVEIPIARIQSRTSNWIELKIPALGVPGSTVSLQALIRSHAAPAGAGWSNPLEFVIAP